MTGSGEATTLRALPEATPNRRVRREHRSRSLGELLKGGKQPEDLLGNDGVMKELQIKLIERMLAAELTLPETCSERGAIRCP